MELWEAEEDDDGYMWIARDDFRKRKREDVMEIESWIQKQDEKKMPIGEKSEEELTTSQTGEGVTLPAYGCGVYKDRDKL